MLTIKLCFLLTSLISTTFSSKNHNLVSYYENLIKEEIDKASKYKLPQNASKYKPMDESRLDFGSYDFIIIGAGSTGSVIANRLSEVKEWSILLIEAGKWGDNFTEIPATSIFSRFSDYNWGYESVPQTTACLGMIDQKCPYTKGKGMGGTTLINGLIYSRGTETDYNKWESLGNPGWSYKDVLPYFTKSENFTHTDPQAPVDLNFHAKGGYLNIEQPLPRNHLLETILQANQELGINVTDYNANRIGVSPIQINTKNGKRWDAATAFIKPVTDRHNLKITTESYVIKIEFDKRTKSVAKIVHFTKQGKKYYARVRKEIILSAGAIGSPQILMLSGIGPKQHLEYLSIPVIQNLEVGSTLRDHPFYPGLTFTSDYIEPIKPLESYIQEFLKGTGPFTISANIKSLGFYQTHLEKTPNYPDIEMMIMYPNSTDDFARTTLEWTKETYHNVWGRLDVTNSFIINIMGLHAKSYGTVRLNSNNPYDYPLINANLLSDSEGKDTETIYEGIQLALKLLDTNAFKRIHAKLDIVPLPACKDYKFLSKDYWMCTIRQLTYHSFHQFGTCSMGPDHTKGAVVSPELRVHGIKKLRVADASVFPDSISGHTNAPCVMVGEKLSNLIKQEYL